MLLALLLAAAGCAAPRGHAAPPGRTAGPPAEAPDRFGYAAERERLLELLDGAREPHAQAAILLELADLAEATRARALARRDELERSGAYAARAERDEMGRLAQRLLDDELERLERLAVDHPEFPRRDEALYRLAFALLDRDSPDAALRHARTLFAEHPASPYVAHAYSAFADRAFEEEDFDQAVKLYEKTIALGNPDAAPWAHFRLGACRLALGEPERAMQSFVDAANAAQALGGPRGSRLRDEALADLVRAYVRAGDPDKALAFLERVAPERVDALLEKLGAAYFDEGRFRESIALNRQVADRVECSPSMARAEVAVFEARLYLGEVVDLKSEGEALVGVFARLARCLPPERLVEFAEAGAMAKEALKSQAERFRREYEINASPAAAEMADELEVMAEQF
jgi:tetratricopeptide (TPR) repeat protein